MIPEKLRGEAKIKPGDRMMVISKHGILQYVPIRSMEKTKGMVEGLNIEGLRDELDRD